MSKKLKSILALCVIVVILLGIVFYTNPELFNKSSLSARDNSAGMSNGSISNPIKSGVTAPQTDSILPENSYDKQDPTKIIKTANINLQTDNYANTMKNINNLITNLNAMVVKMQENMGTTYYELKSDETALRSNEIIVKVPKEKFTDFNNQIKAYANVVSYFEEAQDISSRYADVESKIASYKLQEQQLNELLKKATAAKDLLEISNQIQNVIEQREYLQRQKNSYDNQIEYSTVTIRLTEVESVAIKEKGIGDRMKDTLLSSLNQIKDMFIGLIMLVVYILPYIAIILIIVLIIYIIAKLRKSNHK